MTEDEAYKVHIQYTFHCFCKVVIRHAAIDKILKLRRRWEREVSLDYLMSESLSSLPSRSSLKNIFLPPAARPPFCIMRSFAAALALLPEQTQEEIFRYYFLRQPQRVIGVHIGRHAALRGGISGLPCRR